MTMTMTRALCVLALAACGSDATGVPDAGPVVPVTIALSGAAPGEPFAPLPAAGGAIAVYEGPQGGYHVFLAVRTTGIDPGHLDEPPAACGGTAESENPCIDLVVTDPLLAPEPIDIVVPLHLPLVQTVTPGEALLDPPRLVQLDIGGLHEVAGHTLTLSGSVTDRFGRRAEISVEASALPVPLSPPDAGP
jgi:hypothetical protein